MKRTMGWILVLIVLAGLVFALGAAGAEEQRELITQMMPVAEELTRPRRGGASISGTTNDGSTGVEYTYTVNNGTDTGVVQYEYRVAILDDPRPNKPADTMYVSPKVNENEFTYTFYQTGTYVLFVFRYDSNGNTIPSGYADNVQCRIYITEDSPDNALTSAVQSAAAECDTGDDFDTAVAINDYLAERVDYDNTFTYYSPEAALLRRTSVCNGYSRAFQLIANACGLECRKVNGKGNGGNHAWDAVKINGKWYQVDPTWNDQTSPLFRHVYMGLNDTAFGVNHSNFDYPEGSVTCDTLEDNYFIHTGKWTDLAGNAEANVQAALNATSGDEASITADFGTTAWLEGGDGVYSTSSAILQINGHIVAYALSQKAWVRDDGDTQTLMQGTISYQYNSGASILTGEMAAEKPEIVLTDEMVTVPESITTEDDLTVSVLWPEYAENLEITATANEMALGQQSFIPGDCVDGAVTFTITADELISLGVSAGDRILISVSASAADIETTGLSRSVLIREKTEAPQPEFWPGNATVPGEDLSFTVYPREAGTIYAAILQESGGETTVAGTFTIADGAALTVPGSLLTQTGTYLLSLSYEADADMTDPEEAAQAVFHVAAERYTAPTVTITETGETIGQDITVQVGINDPAADYYLETIIRGEDGSIDYGFWDSIWSGSNTYTATMAGDWVTTPGTYEIYVYAMEAFPCDPDQVPAKAPGIGMAACTLAYTELPAAPELTASRTTVGRGAVFTVTAPDAEAITYSFSITEPDTGEEICGTNPSNPETGDSITFSTDNSDFGDGDYDYLIRMRGKYNGLWSEEAAITVHVVNPPADWAPVMPEAIIPGQDVTVTHLPVPGAVSYNVGVWDNCGMVVYYTEREEAGDFVIPAALFADGGDFYLGIGVSNGVYGDWCWGDYAYSAEPYEEGTSLTIQAGDYTPGMPTTFSLSITDADQVVLQEWMSFDGYAPEIVEYWDTLCVADHPGATVTVFLSDENTIHKVRAAAKKDGVWTAWSRVITVMSQPGPETTLVLPEDLERIEAGAFEGIDAEAVYIPAGCSYIGAGAFANCPNLTYVQYYEGTEIAEGAFDGSDIQVWNIIEP